MSYKYSAFICCSSEDHSWGKWLQKRLSSFKIPRALIGKQGRDATIGKKIDELCLDLTEISNSSNIGAKLRANLQESAYLIVICSPASAQSDWITEQILEFKRQGKENRILSFIIGGEPNAINKPELGLEECFSDALKYCIGDDGVLTDTPTEPIAADARPGKDGKSNSVLKLLAGLLGVNYNDLRQREVKRKRRQKMLLSATLLIIMGSLFAWWYKGYLETSEKSRLANIAEIKRDLSAARKSIADENWLVAIEQLNNTATRHSELLTDKQRRSIFVDLSFALQKNKLISQLDEHKIQIISMDFSPDGKFFASADLDGNIILYNASNWQVLARFKEDNARKVWFSSQSDQLISVSNSGWGDSYTKIYNTEDFSEKELFSIKDKVRGFEADYWLHNRDYVIVKDWKGNIKLKVLGNNLTDNNLITLMNTDEMSVHQVLVNTNKQTVLLIDSQKGLIEKDLKTDKTLFRNTMCKHSNTSLPVLSEDYLQLVAATADRKHLLCSLKEENSIQVIDTRYKDQIRFVGKNEIWFQSAGGAGYSNDVWLSDKQTFDDERKLPLTLAQQDNRILWVNSLKENYDSFWVKIRTNNITSSNANPSESYGEIAAVANGSDIDIVDINKAYQNVINSYPTLTRLETVDNLYVAHLNDFSPKQALLLNEQFVSIGKPVKLIDEKVIQYLALSYDKKYSISIEKKIGMFESPELTVTDFSTGDILFNTPELYTWSFDKNHKHLLLADKTGLLHLLDFTKASLKKTKIDFSINDYQFLFGGANKDYFVLITKDFKVKYLDLTALSVQPDIQLHISSEEEKYNMSVSGSIETLFNNRYLLLKNSNGLSIIDLVNKSPIKPISNTQGSELYKESTFPYILVRLPDGNVQEIDITGKAVTRSYASSLPFSAEKVNSLSDDYLVVEDYSDIFWINREKQSVEKLPLCGDDEVEIYDYDADKQLLMTASNNMLCILDAGTLRPVFNYSIEEKILGVFIENTGKVVALLESGAQIVFKLDLSLSSVLKTAANELKYLAKQPIAKTDETH